MSIASLIASSVLSNHRNYRNNPGSMTAPAFSSSPSIIGIPAVGVSVNYTPGIVTGNPIPTITQQWLLNGSPILGATNATYTPVSGDLGQSLSVTETATNGIGAPAVSTSSSMTVQSSTLPTWAASAPLNSWMVIPGTTGNGGATINAWGGFALRDEGNGIVQICFMGPGGHTDSNDNRVVSLDLLSENPGWVQRVSTSLTPTTDNEPDYLTNYYSWDVVKGDNPKPGSSHSYDYIGWCHIRQKYMRYGSGGTYFHGFFAQNQDTIAPIDIGGGIWQWDAPGTNPLFPYTGNNSSTARGNPADGIVWTIGKKLVPGASSWANQSNISPVRFPNAYDSSRNAIFGMQAGDGQSYGDGTLTARQNFLAGAGSNRNITFNVGAGFTKFTSDTPDYAGMDYDSVNDCFLFYYDRNLSGQNVQGLLKVIPNSGTVWDLSIFTPGGVTPDRTPDKGQGINGRFKYSATLKGFIMIPNASSPAYFLRTS